MHQGHERVGSSRRAPEAYASGGFGSALPWLPLRRRYAADAGASYARAISSRAASRVLIPRAENADSLANITSSFCAASSRSSLSDSATHGLFAAMRSALLERRATPAQSPRRAAARAFVCR